MEIGLLRGSYRSATCHSSGEPGGGRRASRRGPSTTLRRRQGGVLTAQKRPAPITGATAGPRIDPDRPPDPTVIAAEREPNRFRRLLLVLGPGLVTGASDDDPSGVGTYAQAGARFGYGFLWLTIVMLPMMATVQYIAAKLALVSGRGLGSVLRERYPRWVLYPVLLSLVVANTLNAGADIGAIAASVNLLLPVPTVLLVAPVGVGIVLLQILGSYRLITRVFKWIALALLAYVAGAFLTHPDVIGVLRGSLVPTIRFDSGYLALLVALLGTTISPYLFFWQASQEVDDQIAMGRRRLWQRQGASEKELRHARIDTVTGMAFSEVVAFFIVVTFGSTLYVSGDHNITSATDAARALEPLAGHLAGALLAAGLIGAGVLAVPILTGSAAYGLSEAFRWRAGLDEPPSRAPRFYAVIVVATLIAVAINFSGVNPIDALVFSALINGVLAPPMLVLLMLVTNDRRVMGVRRNGRALNAAGWATTIAMSLAALILLVTLLLG